MLNLLDEISHKEGQMEEFLKKIGIDNKGEYNTDNSYTIKIKDSNEYGKFYSILESSNEVEIMQGNQEVTEDGCAVTYEAVDEDYIIFLDADFVEDIYTLTIKDNSEK